MTRRDQLASTLNGLGVGIGVGLAALIVAGGIVPGSAASLSFSSQALTAYRTCTITGTPPTTTAIVDASVRQASPGSNFGTVTTNNVATANGANRRLYVKFDLAQCSPAISSSATVRLATMRLYATAVPSACRTVDIFRVTAAWTETALTWNNQPFGTAINNPSAGSASDTFTIGSPAGCQNQTAGTYIGGATLTGDVSSFISGANANFGWMLRDDVEGSATTYTDTFSAKDLATIAQAPQLVISYVTVP